MGNVGGVVTNGLWLTQGRGLSFAALSPDPGVLAST